jgi:hypothetical protein
MARVRLSERCVLGEVGDVIDVPDHIQELNSGWMVPTTDALTDKSAAPKEAKPDKAAK